VSFRAGLVWAMGLLAAAYVAALALHGVGWGPTADGWFDTVVNGWLGELTLLAPTAVCWLAVSRVGLRRPEVLLMTAAVTSYAAGDTYYVGMTVGGGSLPFPSLADVGYLSVYPLMLAALVVAVRRHVRGVSSSVWWDVAVGSMGAAAVLAVVLRPVLDSAAAGPWSLATAVAVANPLLDLTLVAAVAGIATLRDVRMGGRWVLLAAGLLVFAATDSVYGLQVTADTYVLGTPLDAGWAIGLVLIALWVDGTAQQDRSTTQETRPATGAMALAVSSVATLAGLGVLLTNTWAPVSTLAVALAGVTLLVAAVRSQGAFRLLGRMADLRRRAAATDDLTGLPNRRALYAEGHARLAEPQRRRQALLILDLDKFKEVNDSLGHRAGDQLLVQVGARLREHLRGADMLARLGGDEFAVLLDGAGHDEATEVAVKVRAVVGKPFALEDIALHTSVSIGIALFPDDGPDLSTLLSKADIAMYKAKTSLQGHHVYCSADDADDITRLQTVQELRTALISDQLVVHYQPKIDLDTGQVRAVEALVRWEHPTRGLLYPDAFLHLVEESGLMPTLTRVVLAQALDQAEVWRAQGRPLTVAVNLSASSLVDYDLPKQVASMLAARDVPPDDLQLEITEEFLMADRDRARSILTRLRNNGIQISIDDYGTGYSSLSYLRDLPVDELKLDRSFIFPMADDARAAALVASTIALAHSLDLRMVAEGVETIAAYTELARLGCDQAQGYFMSRPVPAAELDHWLRNRQAVDQPTDVPSLLPSIALSTLCIPSSVNFGGYQDLDRYK
jgi:diguanylate cyclase (GGDEF)-like protein